MEAILACDPDGAIGLSNRLPWRIKEDLQHFKRITTSTRKRNAVIMGRRTWESLKNALPGRLNIILSKTMDSHHSALVAKNLDELDKLLARNRASLDKIFVIGGASLYTLFLKLDRIAKVHLSLTHKAYEHDTSIDLRLITRNFQVNKIERFAEFTYFEYIRKVNNLNNTF